MPMSISNNSSNQKINKEYKTKSWIDLLPIHIPINNSIYKLYPIYNNNNTYNPNPM